MFLFCRSPSRQHYPGGRSASQTEARNVSNSPVGPQAVWLSKKMKELTEKTPTTAVNTASSSRSRIFERNISTSSYCSTINDQNRTERTTRTYLDELGSKMKNGSDLSPSDSFIDRMIISAQRDLSSPLDVPLNLSRNSSIISLNIKQKQSPFNDYQSLPHRSIENELRNLESKYLESRKDSPLKDFKTGKTNLDSKVGYLESSPLKNIQYEKTLQSVTSRDRANSFHDIREESQSRSDSKHRIRHSTLPYGVGAEVVRAAKFDQDMKSILKDLENTGFFSQVCFKNSPLNLVEILPSFKMASDKT